MLSSVTEPRATGLEGPCFAVTSGVSCALYYFELGIESRACPLDGGCAPLSKARGGAKRESNCERTVINLWTLKCDYRGHAGSPTLVTRAEHRELQECGRRA